MIYFPFRCGTNLGNWLFQYAAALSLGQPVTGYLEDQSAKRKLAPYGDLFGSLPIVDKLPQSVQKYDEPEFAYRPLPDMLKRGDWELVGYYQSEKYFNKEDVVRRFAPTPDRISYLFDKYGEWLSKANVTGISVRRGDYMWKAQWHPFVGEQYFMDCIDRIPECMDFIVCSDDISWCKRFFCKRFPNRRFLFVEGESALNQLYIQSMCKNNIISNSSFSWWGAWMNANALKLVLAPSLWFGFAFKRVGIDWRDIYFDGVEIVKNKYTLLRYVWGHITWWWIRFKVWAYPAKLYVCKIFNHSASV